MIGFFETPVPSPLFFVHRLEYYRMSFSTLAAFPVSFGPFEPLAPLRHPRLVPAPLRHNVPSVFPTSTHFSSLTLLPALNLFHGSIIFVRTFEKILCSLFAGPLDPRLGSACTAQNPNGGPEKLTPFRFFFSPPTIR